MFKNSWATLESGRPLTIDSVLLRNSLSSRMILQIRSLSKIFNPVEAGNDGDAGHFLLPRLL